MSTSDSEVWMEEEESICYSESSTPLNHISLMNNGHSTKDEQLKKCCKPTYQVKRLKNKGAIMVLIWSYLLTTLFHFYDKSASVNGLLQLVVWCLTLPFAGWLGDVYFGRYKLIRWCIWTMWVAHLLTVASSVVAQLVDSYDKINDYVCKVLLIIISLALGGFQANIFQFGIDQLHDASTNEITSFVSWYNWTGFSSGLVIGYVLHCVPKEYQILVMLVIFIHLSIALSSVFLFNHWLVKEPVTQNPFKLVYKVIKYAIKNKYPRHRSAFTFCEDDIPSRIDFGKTKYGGPFTTEQVEDVKTFLRLVAVILIGSCCFGELIASDLLISKISDMLTNSHTHNIFDKSLDMCYSEEAFNQTLYYCGAIAIPLYELFFYPVFHRYLVDIGSQAKLVIGMMLYIATTITLMLLEIVARHNYLENTINNNTLQCLFYETHGSVITSIDYRWMAVPYFLRSTSIAVVSVGGIEFIASQAPYSMRGLIMGTTYGMLVLSGALGITLSISFTKRSSVWGTGIISCGFWYALLLVVIEVTVGITLIVIMKWYKKRKREDVLPNEHIFAERYYSRDAEH